jgi:hypothetical protein
VETSDIISFACRSTVFLHQVYEFTATLWLHDECYIFAYYILWHSPSSQCVGKCGSLDVSQPYGASMAHYMHSFTFTLCMYVHIYITLSLCSTLTHRVTGPIFFTLFPLLPLVPSELWPQPSLFLYPSMSLFQTCLTTCTLKMKAVGSFETMVMDQTTWCHISHITKLKCEKGKMVISEISGLIHNADLLFIMW